MGSIVSIANQKGGVGKTTTAVNLSASMAVAEKTCLLVDCDPQGNATTGLGIERKSLEKGLYEFILGAATEAEVILPTELSGFHLIGANGNLIGAEVDGLGRGKGVSPEKAAKPYEGTLRLHFS